MLPQCSSNVLRSWRQLGAQMRQKCACMLTWRTSSCCTRHLRVQGFTGRVRYVVPSKYDMCVSYDTSQSAQKLHVNGYAANMFLSAGWAAACQANARTAVMNGRLRVRPMPS